MFILCQGDLAKEPYIIPISEVPVYSLEELCYYMYHNIYTVTEGFEKLFRAVHQFKKLNVSDLIPGLSSSEFSVMGAILQMGENGKSTSSELAAKTKTLPPAVSRTLRGLEEKGYVERSVDKKDRRNTYISLTEKGWKKGEEVRDRMQDFGCSVMSQLKEEDIDQLVAYLDRIYEIAEKEIDTRKRQN